MEQARGLIAQYGPTKARDLIPRVVRLLKDQWPDAKTFGSITKYASDAAADYDRDQHRLEREREEQLQEEQDREAEVRKLAEEAKLKARLAAGLGRAHRGGARGDTRRSAQRAEPTPAGGSPARREALPDGTGPAAGGRDGMRSGRARGGLTSALSRLGVPAALTPLLASPGFPRAPAARRQRPRSPGLR